MLGGERNNFLHATVEKKGTFPILLCLGGRQSVGRRRGSRKKGRKKKDFTTSGSSFWKRKRGDQKEKIGRGPKDREPERDQLTGESKKKSISLYRRAGGLKKGGIVLHSHAGGVNVERGGRYSVSIGRGKRNEAFSSWGGHTCRKHTQERNFSIKFGSVIHSGMKTLSYHYEREN